MSYDEEIKSWLERNGCGSVEEAKGVQHEATEQFIKPDSDLGETVHVEINGRKVRMYDLCGWSETYELEDIRKLVEKHGLLSTWDDFGRLGELKAEEE